MASSLWKWAMRTVCGPMRPRIFQQPKAIIPVDYRLEEQSLPNYLATRYYPARLGELLQDRYQIVSKLGYGMTSTVWLARDLHQYGFVTLKIFIHEKEMGDFHNREIEVSRRIDTGPASTAKFHLRRVIDDFMLSGPDGQHQCLVFQPTWDSIPGMRKRRPDLGALDYDVLKGVLWAVITALDYLHTECQVIHTDIQPANIMVALSPSDPCLEALEELQATNPPPCKEPEDGRTIYQSGRFGSSKTLGYFQLCDFASSVWGDQEHIAITQPKVFRAPEVMLLQPWGYSIDIWNVGCMIYSLATSNDMLFSGYDEEAKQYRTRCHLAEIIALLGPPPMSFLQRGGEVSNYFREDETFIGAGVEIPVGRRRLEDVSADEIERGELMDLMKRMLKWQPEERATPKELLKCRIFDGQR